MSAEQLHASRAEQRKQRLLELERELDAEEAEALKITEEQRQLLLQPFKAVKAEFTDLDGLRWTQTALRKLQPPPRRATQLAAHPHSAVSKANTFVVITNADLASLSSEDTIRVSATPHSRPSFPSPLLSPKKDLPATDASRHRDGCRSRSPIKGLFPPRTEPPVQSSTQAPSVDVSVYDKTGDAGAVKPAHQPHITRGRLRTLVPPGLTPAPLYNTSSLDNLSSSSSVSKLPAVSKDFNNNSSLSPKTSPQRHTDNAFPLPHRNAPSPPSELISLPPGSSPPIHHTPLLGPDIEIDTLCAFPRPPRTNHHRSPRTRLRSLLQDDHRTTLPRIAPAAKPPSSPSPRAAAGVSTTPTPTMDLSAIITSIQGSLYDDDETPRASPVDGGQGSPSISWIQELAA
ncbi:hypothetical protein M413DRAFT_449596 [Hebeloma cylindrosporum]|uniref:Uncharacterized protein n=1 Tax=Hebeloma cylindrosporum TaxID=76867 RepID=A0A0C3BUL8_HEBCY|nr:hypothetical protein M413DRAFT_449596 [Hebeloma cylindrosporum h7]